MHKITLVSLIGGIIVGFAAQRSRMCFIGGWRDFFLIRDTYLLKGFFSFLLSAALFFFAFYAVGAYIADYPAFMAERFQDIDLAAVALAQTDPEFLNVYKGGLSVCEISTSPLLADYKMPVNGLHIGEFVIPYNTLLLLVCGFVIGLFSTLANGCPVRQHVMAASGNLSAIVYLLFYYAGIIVYEVLFSDYILALN
ncbi:MAG: hypothetical protein IJP33_05585 [Firmicutes bacterium]|nr:hypothetical protein [Bacillota bacterium]